MLDAKRWTELRRGISFVGRRSRSCCGGLASRNAVWTAPRSDEPPTFRVPERSSKLEPYKDEIHQLPSEDPIRGRSVCERYATLAGLPSVSDGRRVPGALGWQSRSRWYLPAPSGQERGAVNVAALLMRALGRGVLRWGTPYRRIVRYAPARRVSRHGT